MAGKRLLFVLFFIASTALVNAQTNIRFEGLGGKIGFILPEDPIDNTISISAHADLGNINNIVHLGAFMEFWTKSYNLPFSTVDGKWTEFIIAPFAKYNFVTNTNITPYVGGGVGFAIISFKNDYQNLGQTFNMSTSESKLDAAIFAFGGIDFPVTDQLKGMVEMKYHINGANFFGIYGGMTYMIPNN